MHTKVRLMSHVTLAPAIQRSSNSAVRMLIMAAPFIVITSLLYGQVLRELFMDWWTVPSLSQGLLIPPLAVWIAWAMRERVTKHPAMPDGRGLLVIAGSCLLLVLGQLSAEFFLARISFVGLLAGVVWTFWGFERLRALTFPLLLLASMVPLPTIVYNSLAAPLQLFATAVSARLAETVGISLYMDGNIIQLAHMTLGVEEACSGLSSISALIVGGILLGFILCTSTLCRTIVLLLSLPAAIVTNIIRVTGTAVLADINSQYALGFYHTFSGWLVFVLGFGMLYSAGWLLHKLENRR